MGTSQSWEEGVCDLAGVCSEAFDDVPATQPIAARISSVSSVKR